MQNICFKHLYMTQQPSRSDDGTRERLIRAAAEVFAEEGFRRATVRAICERAGANVAAVNYHFRDKRGLYAEVIRHAREDLDARYPLLVGDLDADDVSRRIRLFVSSLLARLFDGGGAGCHVRLMAHEMLEPTGELDTVVELGIRPRFEWLCGVVREGAPAPLDDQSVRWIAMSIVAQCLNLFHSRSIIERLLPELAFTERGLAEMADHITEFSVAAIRGYAPREKGQP